MAYCWVSELGFVVVQIVLKSKYFKAKSENKGIMYRVNNLIPDNGISYGYFVESYFCA